MLGGEKLNLFKGFENKAKNDKEEENPIATKQVTVIPQSDKHIYVSGAKTLNLLRKIAETTNKYDAIDIIVNETADGKQALNTYLRLANQGVEIELINATTGKKVKRYDNELREFTRNIGKNNACGLDGLVDQLHYSAIARSGMAVEVVVDKKLTGIDEVLIVDPKTITEFKWLEDKKRYAAYQNGINGNKVDLFEGNFFWIPHQPKPSRPDGTLQFEPAIQTITQFYQLLNDGMKILNRIGYPRYKCTIDREALLNSLPQQEKNTPEAQARTFQRVFTQTVSELRQMGNDSDIVTFDSNQIEILGGGVNGSGIDIRAWFEVIEPLIVNSFQLTPVLMGRLTTGSYSLGTAEYKIVRDNINTMRRASKRMIEEIVNIWARVNGYNVRAVVHHNPIDWQTEIEKLDVQLKKMEVARRAYEYRWITHDEAAKDGYDKEKASQPEQLDMFEFLSSVSQNDSKNTNNQSEKVQKDESETEK